MYHKALTDRGLPDDTTDGVAESVAASAVVVDDGNLDVDSGRIVLALLAGTDADAVDQHGQT